MINYFNEEYDRIYSPKTKEYFREVINSYQNQNYRSAVVMLYSLVVTDLLLKLQELKDMYNDTVAGEILDEINKSRNPNYTNQKSKWEWELIENINKRTQLLEIEDYLNLCHLYDHRNLSAHPALNDNYELYLPNRETVAAHIRNMLDGVLTKPPVFIKKIIDTITEDLATKKDVYKNDDEMLSNYLINKYFSRMSDKMFVSIFKTIWKFVFVLDNDDCKENRIINKKCLNIMLAYKTDILLKYIKDEPTFSNIDLSDPTKAKLLLSLCTQTAELYKMLDNDLKFQLRSVAEKSNEPLFLILWFCFPTFGDYYNYIMKWEDSFVIPDKIHNIIQKYFMDNAHCSEFVDFCISYFSKSRCFNSADNRFTKFIAPNLQYFNKEHAIKLISTINSNDQIHRRNRSYIDNTLIVEKLTDVLGSKFDYSEYTYFTFEKPTVQSEVAAEEDTYDEELPF